MKSIILITLLSMMLGCAAKTQIHLYARHLSVTETNSIKSKLEESDFEVIVNNFVFPNNINKSTILYSPLLKDKTTPSNVANALLPLNYPITNSQSLFAGKHFYTKNNLGLFIVSESNTSQRQLLDIANNYQSTNCDHLVELNLNKDGTYKLTFEQLPYPDETDYLEGQWRIPQYPFMVLSINDGYDRFYFEVATEKINDHIGEIKKTTLTAQDRYSHIHSCDFEYGIRL